ncbi:MAG: serine/threonine protein kinase, partial [Candidatus Obscuribacterales bacterium]|nr:serine/threonine protein kinase [Candidatus Obscuribacterales bacterium]
MTSEQAESIFDDKYKILGQLGAGGLGTVYRAKQIDLGRTVALKILHNRFAVDDDFKSRFLREAKVLNQLKHPNIVQIFHLGVAATGQPYLAMELIEGKNCRQLLKEQDRLPTLVALKIAHDAAIALSYVHENGIVHRDLKPENILVLNEPEANTVKLIDFGLVRLLDSTENNQKLTQTGDLLGTAAYMSPEQCKGQKADERADIYSLGACLFELLTGEKCYAADTDVGLLYKHATEAPPTVKASMVEVFAPSLDKLIAKSMQKDPAMRFQSMQEMANAIDAVMEEIEKRISTRSNFALAGQIPHLAIISIGALALCSIALFGLVSQLSLEKKENVGQAALPKQKELAAAETVHLPTGSEQLSDLVYLYRDAKGPEVAISIAKRWLRLHENDAQPEEKTATYALLVNLYGKNHQSKEMEYFANKVFAEPEALYQIISVTNSMASCYASEQHYKKALDIIEKTLNAYPTFKQQPPLALLDEKAEILVAMGDYDKAIKLRDILDSTSKAGAYQGESESLSWRFSLMTAYSRTKQESKLKAFIDDTIKVLTTQFASSPATMASTYLQIAHTLKEGYHDTKLSLHYAELALPLLIKCKDVDGERSAEGLIGSILLQQGKNEEAMAVFQRIASYKNLSEDSQVANFFNMYECSKQLNDASLTESYIKQAVKHLKDEYKLSGGISLKKRTDIYWNCVSSLADEYIKKDAYPEAEHLINEWLSIAMENKIEPYRCEKLREKKVEILFKLSHYSEALKCIDEALKFLDEQSSEKSVSEETWLTSMYRLHMLRDIALSSLNNTEESKKETHWIVHSITTDKKMSPETRVNYLMNVAQGYLDFEHKSQADICCFE